MKAHGRFKTHSYISTLATIRQKRRDAIEAGLFSDAAHWRNCERALEIMANSDRRWGEEICINHNEN